MLIISILGILGCLTPYNKWVTKDKRDLSLMINPFYLPIIGVMLTDFFWIISDKKESFAQK